MTRSKLSTKVVLLASGIGLSLAAFAGSQPAAAQTYSGEYNCPESYINYPTSGCLPGAFYEPYDYEYPYGAYYRGLHDFGHGLGVAHAGGFGGFHGGGGFGGGGHR